MARLPRYIVPGQPLHIIQRGNNRSVIFVADDDYLFYLECLAEAAKRAGCDIHAYVLMTNHVHLLVTPHGKESVAKLLQSVGRRYVRYFNQTHLRTGTLWEGRYKATLIDSEAYLLACYRYIELNPVRAGMVSQPSDYFWSSCRCHADGVEDARLTEHALYRALGLTDEAKKRGQSRLNLRYPLLLLFTISVEKLFIMARLPRYIVPGQPLHIIQRGNNRSVIFVADDDYLFYLECLAEAAKRAGCDIHAYVLMTNHVHLLVTPHGKESVAKLLQSVGRRYVRYFNQTHLRTGTLWEGRYKATLIDSEAYLLACYRYIELNPVRAGMVSQPSDYFWSSCRCHADGVEDARLTEHALYRALGLTDEGRRAAYRALLNAGLDEREMVAIREATNKAWVLGNDHFKAEIATLVGRRVSPLPKGRPRSKVDVESVPS